MAGQLTIAGHTAKNFGGTPIKGVDLIGTTPQQTSQAYLYLRSRLNDTGHSSSNNNGSSSVQVTQVRTTPSQVSRSGSPSVIIPNSPVSIFGNTGLSAGNVAKQQKISDQFGIATFDTQGDISTIPTNQPIQNTEGSGKFAPQDFGAVIDTINAALFPQSKPQNPADQPSNISGGQDNSGSLLDALKSGLTDLGSQLNQFIGSFKIPDPNAGQGSQGNLPQDATQTQSAQGGGLLGGAPSVDTSTNSPVADTSTQAPTSFLDQLKKNPTELIIVIIAIVAFIALIARRR